MLRRTLDLRGRRLGPGRLGTSQRTARSTPRDCSRRRLDPLLGASPRSRGLGRFKALAPADLSLLFSGGADSTCGAPLVRSRKAHRPLLASHFDWRNISGQQSEALAALESALGTRPANLKWRFARHDTQSDRASSSRTRPRDAPARCSSSRSALRSARRPGNELWIAENGFTSLNPPLWPESLGALSTRTTHPAFVSWPRRDTPNVGSTSRFATASPTRPKAEMFGLVRDSLGTTRAGEPLSATHSCGKPQRDSAYAPDAPCGVCLGCLVRRGASSPQDCKTTRSTWNVLPARRRRAWLSPKRRSTYQALQDRLEAGFSEDDVLDIGLPDDADLDAALRLLQVGLAELAQVQIP